MAYFINSDCIGCTICAKKCPVPCIEGDVKKLHVIDPSECIDCGVCASYCPVDCIQNQDGIIEKKIEANNRPIAVVYEDNCTGCEWCVDVCPFDCLEMTEGDSPVTKIAANVRPKDCVGCKLCEEACLQKGAIVVEYPDGSYAANIGVKVKLDNPIRV